MKCNHVPSLSDSLTVKKVAGLDSGNNIKVGWTCEECGMFLMQKEMPTRKEEEDYEEKAKDISKT